MEGSQTNISQKKIDIRKVFHEKNPGLAPYIPGFVYRYLSRILHLDFINDFLDKHGGKKNLEFAEASVQEFNITTEIKGYERLPETSRLIFVSNHPLGGFDGMLLISLIGRKYPGIKTLANDILMNISNMDGVFVPINKHGRQSQQAVKDLEAIYQGDDPLLTFPAGLVSRRRKGIIRDVPWKKNFISKARQYKRDVIPVWVSGRCTNFFYRLANLRKFLRIKSNIEMFFLPDETYRHRNEHIRIVFGKPVSWEKFSREKRPAEWADLMQDLIYKLKDDPDVTL